VSCEGGQFDLIKIPYVTIIDALDTLIVLGDYQEFKKASHLIIEKLPSFDFDVNVSLFETTIRLLGGLLSAHLFSVDPILQIYNQTTNTILEKDYDTYHNGLLKLAIDLGDRLLPAFNTKTGIPYGTVNLRSGVPKGETKIASTAGAGTLLMEFEVLSYVTGDEKYGKAAYLATEGIYNRRSELDLVGKHINTETGQWQETLSGVGSNSDSFYEYLLKSYGFGRNLNLYQMFSKTYKAVKQLILIDDEWFCEVDMYSGKLQRRRVENLDAFWPGVEALMGNTPSAALQLNALYSVWMDLGFLPEELDQISWENNKGIANPHYALRPELIESTYYQYQTTGDRTWLLAGKVILESIEKYTRTGCGYAAINDVSTLELHDSMPSFFLSETCKYVYLLFDEDNFIHSRPYVFNTEAHPFDLMQLHLMKKDRENKSLTEETRLNQQKNASLLSQLLLGSSRRKRHKNKISSPQNYEPANNDDGFKETLLPLKCGIQTYSTKISSSFFKDELDNLVERSVTHPNEKKSRRKNVIVPSVSYLKELSHSRKNKFRGENLLKSMKSLVNILGYREKLLNPATKSSTVSKREEKEKCWSRHRPSATSVETGKPSQDASPSGSEGDDPSSSTMPEIDSKNPPEEEEITPLKSLELSLGNLGQFSIKVYVDGFRISNKQDNRVLEITNVGKKSIFLREADNEGVRSVIGRFAGNIQTCFIEATTPVAASSVTHGQQWRR
jgi:hypothetical protein